MVQHRIPRPGEALPTFELPEAEGGKLELWEYHGRRNLVLFFAHSPDCPSCEGFMKELAADYEDIRAQEGEALAILPVPCARASDLKRRLELPLPVLGDESLETFRRYGVMGDNDTPRAALFISDRFGTIYFSAVSDDASGFPSLAEIVMWLDFIQRQCPECGAPEWNI